MYEVHRCCGRRGRTGGRGCLMGTVIPGWSQALLRDHGPPQHTITPNLDNLPQWQGPLNSPPWFLCRLCLPHQNSTSPQVPSTNPNPPLRTQSNANSSKKQKGTITQLSINSASSVLLQSLHCLCYYTSHILLSLNNHKSPTFRMLCVLTGSISSTRQSHEALWLCGLSFHRTETRECVACSRPYNQCLKYRQILGHPLVSVMTNHEVTWSEGQWPQ